MVHIKKSSKKENGGRGKQVQSHWISSVKFHPVGTRWRKSQMEYAPHRALGTIPYPQTVLPKVFSNQFNSTIPYPAPGAKNSAVVLDPLVSFSQPLISKSGQLHLQTQAQSFPPPLPHPRATASPDQSPCFQPCFSVVQSSPCSQSELLKNINQNIHCCCSVTKPCLTLWDPMNPAQQASLSFTISWSLLKLMSIESVMPSNGLSFYCLLLFLPSTFPISRVFSNVSAVCIRWPNYWSFSFSISPSSEYLGLISFRIYIAICEIDGQMGICCMIQGTQSQCSVTT